MTPEMLQPETVQAFESLAWALVLPSLGLGFCIGLMVGPWAIKQVVLFLARVTWPYRIKARRKLIAAVRARANRNA